MDTKNTIKTLSQSLLDEVKKIMKKEKGEKSEKGESDAEEKREHCSEALKGNQHKLDANKNGKVDAHDFKLLRKKKGVAETYTTLKSGEEISEEEVEEAVKEPYAVGMAAAMKATGDKPPLKKSTILKAHKIARKIKEDTEEVSEQAEQIDELSKKTLATYAIKAKDQMGRDEARAGYQRGIRTMDGKGQGEMEKAHDKRAEKRSKGIDTALNKLAKEEVEQIDELSQDTMARYASKASKERDQLTHGRNDSAEGARKYFNRKNGVRKAIEKTTNEEVEDLEELSTEKLLAYRKKARAADTIKHDVWADTADEKIKKKTGSYNPSLIQRAKAKLAKEELDQVELTQEEIDRLDAMMADLDEARGRPPKEGSDAWKKRQEEGAAEQDEPRQHPIQQLERIKRDMRGGGDFKHRDGSTHHLTGGQASKLLDKYHGLKPAEKEEMQKDIHANHAGLKKHL